MTNIFENRSDLIAIPMENKLKKYEKIAFLGEGQVSLNFYIAESHVFGVCFCRRPT